MHANYVVGCSGKDGKSRPPTGLINIPWKPKFYHEGMCGSTFWVIRDNSSSDFG